jgi:hypothetical protein
MKGSTTRASPFSRRSATYVTIVPSPALSNVISSTPWKVDPSPTSTTRRGRSKAVIVYSSGSFLPLKSATTLNRLPSRLGPTSSRDASVIPGSHSPVVEKSAT